MADKFSIVYSAVDYAQSLNEAVGLVAAERRFIAATTPFELEATRAFVGTVVQRNLAQYLLLAGARVVGWCDIIPKELEGFRHVGYLGMGIVDGYRGQGLGRRLLQASLDHARDVNRLEKVELTVFDSNTSALALYRSAGFEIEGQRRRGRKMDGVYETLVDMAYFF